MRGKICSRMKRHATPFLVCVAVGLFGLGAHGAEFKLGQHTFTLPEGFEIELVAGPPLVDRPVTADFDEAGRLYVTDSSGSNDKSKSNCKTSLTGFCAWKIRMETAVSTRQWSLPAR
jgi:hypothetical protein